MQLYVKELTFLDDLVVHFGRACFHYSTYNPERGSDSRLLLLAARSLGAFIIVIVTTIS